MNRKRRVLFLLPVGERGGAETLFYDIIRLLDKERFDPVVFFLREGPYVSEIRDLGVETLVRPIRRLRNPRDFFRTVVEIKRTIQQRGASVVFSSLGYGHVYGGSAALVVRVPAIWWQHGIASKENRIDALASRIPARLIITSSHAAAKAQVSAFAAHEGKVRVIYPGVALEKFRRIDPARVEEIRAELKLRGSRAVISTIGRLEAGKGQEDLIRAAKIVSERMPGVKFLIIGSEMFGVNKGYLSRLRRLVIDDNLESDVIFTGFRKDIPELLAATDIVVHAARSPESFGLSLCEAMAAGKPVITTDVGGPREIIVDGETGYIVPPGVPERVAEAMVRLLSDPIHLREMGQAARRRAEECFDIRRTVGQVEQVLEEVR